MFPIRQNQKEVLIRCVHLWHHHLMAIGKNLSEWASKKDLEKGRKGSFIRKKQSFQLNSNSRPNFKNTPLSTFDLLNYVKHLGIKYFKGAFSRDNLPIRNIERMWNSQSWWSNREIKGIPLIGQNKYLWLSEPNIRIRLLINWKISFYEPELLKAEQDVFHIEKVIRWDYTEKGQALVRWLTYNDDFNTWVPLKDFKII